MSMQFNGDYGSSLGTLQLLATLLISAPALFLLSRRGKDAKSEHVTLLFILLFSVSLRLIVPLSDGNSTFFIFRDPLYNFQLTRIYMEQGRWIWGLQTTRAIPQLFTPFLQFLSVSMANVTGLNLYTICRFLPSVVFTWIIILLLFSAFKRLLGSSSALLASFVFAVCYKFNAFSNAYLQESLGVLFFAMAFYTLVLISAREKSSRGGFMIFVLAVFSLVSTHFFSGFVFVVTVAVALVVSSIQKSLFSTNFTKAVFLIPITAFYGWAVFVAGALLHVNINEMREYLGELSLTLQNPFRTGGGRGINLPPLSPLETPVVYAGILIPVSLGLFAFAVFFSRGRRNSGYSSNWLRIFGVLALVFGTLTLLGLRGFVTDPDVAYRFITFLYIFLAPISAVGFDIVQRHLKRANSKSQIVRRLQLLLCNGFIIAFLVIPVISASLLVSGAVPRPTIVPDEEVLAASSWLSSYGHEYTAVVGETSLAEPIAAYSRIDFLGENSLASSNETITEIVYYQGNSSALAYFLQQISGKTFFIINKHFVDFEFFKIRSDTRGRIPSVNATERAFSALNQLTVIDKIYDGECPSVYVKNG